MMMVFKSKRTTIMSLVMLALLICGFATYFLINKDEILSKYRNNLKGISNNKDSNNNDNIDKSFSISINDKIVCEAKEKSSLEYCISSKYSQGYYLIKNTSTVNVVVNNNFSEYEIYNKTTYDLKKGINTIVYGKDKSTNTALSFNLYLIPNELSSETNNTVDDLVTKSIKFQAIYYFIMRDSLNNMLLDDTTKDYEKCVIEGCKDLNNFKTFLQNKYYMTEGYALEKINELIESKDIKIINNELYFKTIITGFGEGETTKFYRSYIEDGDLYLIININAYDNSTTYGSYLIKTKNISGNYLIDNYTYLGLSL